MSGIGWSAAALLDVEPVAADEHRRAADDLDVGGSPARELACVKSPRTPIDGERSSTAEAKSRTDRSIRRNFAASSCTGACAPTPSTTTGILSRRIRWVIRMRFASKPVLNAFASGMT